MLFASAAKEKIWLIRLPWAVLVFIYTHMCSRLHQRYKCSSQKQQLFSTRPLQNHPCFHNRAFCFWGVPLSKPLDSASIQVKLLEVGRCPNFLHANSTVNGGYFLFRLYYKVPQESKSPAEKDVPASCTDYTHAHTHIHSLRLLGQWLVRLSLLGFRCKVTAVPSSILYKLTLYGNSAGPEKPDTGAPVLHRYSPRLPVAPVGPNPTTSQPSGC